MTCDARHYNAGGKLVDARKSYMLRMALIGGILVAAIMVVGTVLMGRSASKDTEDAVHSVSLLYLDELAGRREQVVAANLRANIRNFNVAISLLTDEDLSDMEHLQAYQSRMRQLYDLEKFAFVDENGLIYTADGTRDDIDQYGLDYKNLTEPRIFVHDSKEAGKKVIIAVSVAGLSLGGKRLVASFMEIDMGRMLQGVSVQSSSSDTTFCNIYTKDGVALTEMVLGGLASEDNLLDALGNATFEGDATAESVRQDFAAGRGGAVTFTYGGVLETLDYVPIEGTDWMLTYLMCENVISEKISEVTNRIVMRSMLQSALTAVVLLGMFGAMSVQIRRNSQLMIEKEASEAENRIKQRELEQRLALQEQLLQQEKLRAEQDSMITALASDYRSVYYVNLDEDDAICYRSDDRLEDAIEEGAHIPFHETFVAYANDVVAEPYRKEFLSFIDPTSIRARLEQAPLIAYRYLTIREGVETYEMLRMAGVRHAKDRKDGIVHAVGVGFTNIDAEMRESMARNQALSDALVASEEASKAKTTFLSNMSHEIRTPMNAIIGLDNIALNDPDISDKTRDHLIKIGESADHLLSLINDILDMSRIESGRMTLKNEEFSFPRLMDQVNTIFTGQAEERGIAYECHVDDRIDPVYIGDSVKLRQVLINILGNAVKFTPEGGRVGLDVERAANFDGRTTLRFIISDTGIGMSKEFLPRIFDTFSQENSSTTTKYGSSGLGLAITKSIVEMMNGDIQVQSERGVGSTFTVSVTLMDADQAAIYKASTNVAPHEMSVLVVDDDPIACEHARLVLEKAGIAAEVAQSGFQAIEMVELRHARREPYNLILVDWKMPDMDGVETTRRIHAITGDQSAIVMLTAYRWDDVLEEAIQAGVDSFISKPVAASTVMEEFKSALQKRESGSSKRVEVADLAGKRVLLAEDVDINAEIMEMILEMREIVSERAVNGRVAVEMYESHPAGYYDAILMDIRMPEMDGLEATMTIRAMDRADAKSIPIVALTANAFDEDVQRSLQSGLNAHLTKPVQPESLFETLEVLCR